MLKVRPLLSTTEEAPDLDCAAQARGISTLLLARMTDYVETGSGQKSRYAEYAQRGREGYEIEHI